MKKIIFIITLLAVGYYLYINIDIENIKTNTIESLKNEKTIKAVNSSRDRTQEEIYQVTH